MLRLSVDCANLLKSQNACTRAWRVYVAHDPPAMLSAGRGPVPSRQFGITSPIPLGIESVWDNILERHIFDWLQQIISFLFDGRFFKESIIDSGNQVGLLLIAAFHSTNLLKDELLDRRSTQWPVVS